MRERNEAPGASGGRCCLHLRWQPNPTTKAKSWRGAPSQAKARQGVFYTTLLREGFIMVLAVAVIGWRAAYKSVLPSGWREIVLMRSDWCCPFRLCNICNLPSADAISSPMTLNDNMLSAIRPILWGWRQEVCGSSGCKANCFKGLVKLLAELEIMLIQGGDDFRR